MTDSGDAIRLAVPHHYAGEWPAERFSKNGISYMAAEMSKSELYIEALPLLTSGQAELPDDPRLLNQLRSLDRRTGRSGKDSIDHAPRAHDDIANAVAGALVMLAGDVTPAARAALGGGGIWGARGGGAGRSLQESVARFARTNWGARA